ncbi:ATP-binding protein, partial [Teratosphaeriaceae sp. CCFEE 6253]
TDNILFICAGAFNGLHRMILDRVSKGSIGFGAPVRSGPSTSGDHETMLDSDDADGLFAKHLPFYQPRAADPQPPDARGSPPPKRQLNTLDLVEPQDLQKYGLIPELVGRIPLACALSPLDIDALVQVLTEPRNALLQQYKQLFALSGIELRITTPALRRLAETASTMRTGARGLKTALERVLADSMFEAPGSGVKSVLVTEAVAERRAPAVYFYRGEGARFRSEALADEEAWEARCREREREGGESELERRARITSEGGAARTFEEYREKATAGGFV